MPTIRKRGDKWQVQVRRKGCAALSKTFASRKDAEIWGRKIEASIDLGEPIAKQNSDQTLRELLQKYMTEITPPKKGREAETRRLKRLIADPISNSSIASLDGQTLSAFRDRRLNDGVRACQYDLVLIRHAIEIGKKEWGMFIPQNPVDEIRIPNGIRRRERRLLPGEYEKLRTAAGSTRSRYLWPMVELAIETAMRRSELLSLEWRNVDLGARLALLPDTKNGSPRTVPLTAKAVSTLEALPRSSSRVFPSTECAIRQAWERLVARAGINDLRFHDLRHEAISRFFEMGLSVPEVALISGHRDPRMLFRYTHLKAGDVANKLLELG